MTHYKYLIIGGGMTADSAVKGIREVDAHGSIGLISAEPDPPYDRPPLSKKLWKKGKLEKIWRGTESQGVDMRLGRSVRSVDLQSKRVTHEDGEVYTFEKLLLATGGTPRRLPFGDARIIYFRTVQDYLRLRKLAEQGERFAVIGGGYIGTEVAAALAMNGKSVTMLIRGKGIGSGKYPDDLARFLNDFYREKGVEVLAEEELAGLESRGNRIALKTRGGRELVVDGVVAGLGIEPNTRLAEEAGLQVENGIVVDESLRTCHPDVYAAGDVASFPDLNLGKQRRIEHEDSANAMGRHAGRAMAGEPEPYRHMTFFYSDLFELGYEAVGELDTRLEVVADWKELGREGVVYYLQDRRVRGVLLWNVWDQVDAARRLIAEPGPFRPEDLRGRLPAVG